MRNNLTKKNYAAIYARISGNTDKSNSINAQIDEGKALAKEHSLLIYQSYVDRTSGKTNAPKDRKGFKKLLNDAKAGLFKTLIIYRYDRLVRNYNDWLETSSILKKLGIKILLSDKSQPVPSDSPQSEFLTNLTILFADLEPSNISSRSNKGKEIRRENGVYVCGRGTPFGYTKISSPISGCTSSFVQNSVEKEYLQLIFDLYLNAIENKKGTHLQISKEIFNKSFKLLNFIKENSDHIFNFSSNKLYIQYENFIKKLFSRYNNDFIKEKIENILYLIYLGNTGEINKKLTKFRYLLKNSIYGGYMLRLPSLENNPMQGLIKKNNSICIDINKFIKITNLENTIDYNTFLKVHEFILKETIKIPDNSPEFLFKGLIKCNECQHKLHLENQSILSCSTPSCTKYFWSEIKEIVIGMIVDNVLLKNNSGFIRFKSILNKDLFNIETSLNKSKTEKIYLLSEYISTTKFSDEEINNLITLKESDISYLTSLTSNYRGQLAYIKTLESVISSLNKANLDSHYIAIKKEIVRFISQNENLFASDLREILTEIKVGVNNKRTLKTTIQYKFTPDKNSNIYKSIYN